MPLILRDGAYRIFFYSNEGDPREPMRVHVRSAGREAKIWLQPVVAVAGSSGFNSKELKAILVIVEANTALIEQAWHDHFGD